VELPEILLRPYHPSDLDTLYRIDQACFPPGIAYGRLEMKFYLRSKGAYCQLAEISDEIAGFVLTERPRKVAHIITLDVLEAYRRRKIGSLLLDTAEREAAMRGAERMVLETATTNKPAIALWNRHGYRQTVTIKNYYGDGLDAFEMQKQLHGQAAR
jgi:ribosomal-protein-alanine N-acetyltransferase